jgi:Tol biopolymer transport system component
VRRAVIAGTLVAAGIAAGGVATIVHAADGDVVLVSRATGPSGTSGNGTSSSPSASADGRWVVFQSAATNLDAAATSGKTQVYLRDVQTGATTLVSRADGAAGAAGDNNSTEATVSDDGRYVAFLSTAANLSADDTNGVADVYVRDVVAGTTALVSRNTGPTGAVAAHGAAGPEISGDGSTIAFSSIDALAPGAAGASTKVYVRDRATQANELASGDGPSQVGSLPALSSDGRYVAFAGQVPNGTGILVRDRVTHTTQIASRQDGPDGAPAKDATQPSISADGRYVAWRSLGNDVSPDDSDGTNDVFERDLVEGWTVLVSRADGATGAATAYPSSSDAPHVSADGRRVVFLSSADNLSTLDNDNGTNVYVRDTLAGTLDMVHGRVGQSPPPQSAISGDAIAAGGGFVAYDSAATILPGEETGTHGDVFRRELGAEPAVPLPTGDVADLVLDEGPAGVTTNAIVPVTLSHPLARPVDFTYTTHDVTAVGGTDYTTSTGHVRFAVGQVSQTIAVPITGDDAHEGDETFTVSLSDGREGLAGRTGTVTIRDDDAAPAPGDQGGGGTGTGGGQTMGPPPGTTLTSEAPKTSCNTTMTVGLLHLRGCLSGDQLHAISHGVVSVDGLTVTPAAADGKVDFAANEILSEGDVTVAAGPLVLFKGQWHPTWRASAAVDSIDLGPKFVSPPAGSGFFGLTMGTTMYAVAHKDGSITYEGQIALPIFGAPVIPYADLHLKTDDADGLVTSQMGIHEAWLTFVVFGVRDLDLRVDPVHGGLAGSATVELPTPNHLKIGAGFAFDAQGFKSAYGEAQNLNVAIQPGLYLQRVRLAIGVRPLSLGGGIGVSGGPIVPPMTAPIVQIDGNFAFVFGDPGQLHIDGDLRVANIPIATAYFDAYTNGDIDFGAHVDIGLPDISNPAGTLNLARVTGDVTGWFDSKAFNIEGHVGVRVLGVDVAADLLGSSKGLAACGQIAFFRGGVGYDWTTKQVTVMGPFLCDVGPWRATKASAAQAGGARTLRFDADRQLIALTGDGAPPSVVLRGPGGQALQTPAAGQPPVKNDKFVVLQDPTDHITYVAIDHAKGTWTIAPAAGSAPLRAVRSAGLLPAPKVKASVSGHGPGPRTLRYAITPQPGQKVTFAEIGSKVHRVIGRPRGSKGTLRFTPAAGRGGRRKIVALVTTDGRPRASLTVATYTAPAPAKLTAPARLKGTLAGGKVKLTWRAVAGAREYLIAGKNANGGPLQAHATGKQHAATVTDVLPITGATLTVRAIDRTGHLGRAAKVVVKAKR